MWLRNWINKRLDKKKAKANQLYNEIQRKKYVVSQHNQIKRKKCKLPKVQQNKIIEEFNKIVTSGELETIINC
jgi:hypothetical protein